MEEGFRPDAILLDFMMPVMDGGELVAELRRRGVTAPVLLASAYPGLERRARDLGVAGSIAKPFRYQALEAKLRSVLGEPGGPRGPGSPLPGTRAFRLPDWNGWWHWGPRRRAPLAPFLV
jgi:DNA-binding response OmpR family regulator